MKLEKKFLARGLAALLLGGFITYAGVDLAKDRFELRSVVQDRASCLSSNPKYIVVLKKAEYKKGDMIVFSVKNNPLYKDGEVFLKFLKGVEGDAVEVNKDGVFINGELTYTGMMHADKFGGVDRFYTKGKIVKDRLWVMGDTPESFDSRYWGTIDKSQVLGKAFVLW